MQHFALVVEGRGRTRTAAHVLEFVQGARRDVHVDRSAPVDDIFALQPADVFDRAAESGKSFRHRGDAERGHDLTGENVFFTAVDDVGRDVLRLQSGQGKQGYEDGRQGCGEMISHCINGLFCLLRSVAPTRRR